jgi:integrative and conjugative element protein (TIGR02256 family)
MYTNDFNAMCAEVYKHQHIETGGNLFGLWTTSGSAVIHVVLGPGQGCKRTNTSFHQDLEYMARVGRFVNEGYMLCHIGEWHSHHNLSLCKPSAGDESTVKRNFPQGMSKFLVIIANIRNGDTIKLSPYFFTHGGERYEIAERVVVESDSPFSTDAEIMIQIHLGAERKEDQQRRETTMVEYANHSGASLRNGNTGSNSQRDGNTNPTRLQANQSSSLLGISTSKPSTNSSDSLVNPSASTSKANPSTSDSLVNLSTRDSHVNQSSSQSQANPSGSTPCDHGEPMDTDDSDLRPSRDYEEANASPENATPESQASTSAGSQADPDKNKNDNEEVPSERQMVLKKVHDHLKNWFGRQSESMFKFECSKDSPGVIEISFKHNSKYWMVRFPKDFPNNPAKLFYSYWEVPASLYNKCSDFDLVKPLNNEVHILLSIKKICGVCKVCKHFTKESLSRFDLNSQSMNKLGALVDGLVNELSKLGDVCPVNITHPFNTSHAEVKFKHANKHWIIDFPAQFPDIPAKVYYLLHEGSSQKRDVLFHGKHSYGPQDLNTFELIIQAIQSNSD